METVIIDFNAFPLNYGIIQSEMIFGDACPFWLIFSETIKGIFQLAILFR